MRSPIMHLVDLSKRGHETKLTIRRDMLIYFDLVSAVADKQAT